MKYSEKMNLSPYIERYSYFPELTNILFRELGPRIRSRKYLTCADLALICVWKALLWQVYDPMKWEQASVHPDTDKDKIRRVTASIFETDFLDKLQVRSLLESLVSLNGVGFPVATTILSVTRPDLYGVVDRHVLSALDYKTDDVNAFVEAIFRIREIAREQSRLNSGVAWTPRMVDMALWKLDQENGAR